MRCDWLLFEMKGFVMELAWYNEAVLVFKLLNRDKEKGVRRRMKES
jgi:hypothetical protein